MRFFELRERARSRMSRTAEFWYARADVLRYCILERSGRVEVECANWSSSAPAIKEAAGT